VVGRCHAEESLHVANSGVFAVVVNNSIQQWWSGSSQAVHNGQSPPHPTRCGPDCWVSLMSILPCLKHTDHFWAVLSALESSP
jgi:hypothetical protein